MLRQPVESPASTDTQADHPRQGVIYGVLSYGLWGLVPLYFKLVDAQGKLLLQSEGFASPKEAGQAVKRLQELSQPLPALLQEIPVKHLVTAQELESALQQLLAARD